MSLQTGNTKDMHFDSDFISTMHTVSQMRTKYVVFVHQSRTMTRKQ